MPQDHTEARNKMSITDFPIKSAEDKRFIMEYWQWIITSIISPLLAWWYKGWRERKKKKKKS